VISADLFFTARGEELGALALGHAVPTISPQGREFVRAGGLMSYGGSLADAYRLAGVYTSRILKGDKPSDLPVPCRGRVAACRKLGEMPSASFQYAHRRCRISRMA